MGVKARQLLEREGVQILFSLLVPTYFEPKGLLFVVPSRFQEDVALQGLTSASESVFSSHEKLGQCLRHT